MIKFKEKVYFLLKRANDDMARVFLISSSYLWGIMLLLPGNTFERSTYNTMSLLAPENVWGLAFIVYATLCAFSYKNLLNSKYQLMESGIGFVIWTLSAACLIMSAPYAPAASAPNFVGACISWWVLIRTGLKHA